MSFFGSGRNVIIPIVLRLKEIQTDILKEVYHLMKLTKRVIAGMIAVLSAFSVVGCGKDDGSGDGDRGAVAFTDEQQKIVEELANSSTLPDRELANKEINWFGHYDLNPSEGKSASADIELFKLKYDGVIKDNSTTWETRFDDLAKLVIADTAPDFFAADDMDVFPKGAIRGMFQPIDDYIDFDSALWSDVKTAADEFVFNGNHYVALIEVQPNLVCVYNRATIDAEGYEDPAELFANGEWDLDIFFEMCENFVDPDQEKYALDGYWYDEAIQQTTGVPLIGLEDGKIVSNLGSAEIAVIENRMYDETRKGIVFPRKDNNWKTRGSGQNGEGLGDGKTLFIPIGLWALEDAPEKTKLFGDIAAGEVMFVPMPDNTDNEPYYVSARVNGYVLCTGAPNPEGFAAYMDCKRACLLDEGIQQIGVEQLKNVYGWSDEMIEMKKTIYDMCKENPVFEFYNGVDDQLSSLFNNTISAGTMTEGEDGATTWTELVGQNESAVNYLVNQANTEIANNTGAN